MQKMLPERISKKKIWKIEGDNMTKIRTYKCKTCGGEPEINVPPYQRKNPSYKICRCEEPKLV